MRNATPALAVLWDLDGCLSDSAPAILASHRHALAAMNLADPGQARLRSLIGPPLGDALRELLPALGVPTAELEHTLERYVATYRADYQTRSVAWAAAPPGVADAARTLHDRGVLQAVATSKPRAYARPIVDALGLAGCFAVVEGPDTDATGEPKAATIARVLSMCGLVADRRVAMVGDRRHDVEAARAHGLRAVGVTWGIGSRQELHDAGADDVVDTPAELLTVLLGA